VKISEWSERNNLLVEILLLLLSLFQKPSSKRRSRLKLTRALILSHPTNVRCVERVTFFVSINPSGLLVLSVKSKGIVRMGAERTVAKNAVAKVCAHMGGVPITAQNVEGLRFVHMVSAKRFAKSVGARTCVNMDANCTHAKTVGELDDVGIINCS
jgi:hypothetical protein